MSIINKAAVAATLGLALIPWIALTAAHAETATVKISDLTQGAPAQVETFNRRVDQAADKLCAHYTDQRNLSQVAACKTAVRDEAEDKLSDMKSGAVSVASR